MLNLTTIMRTQSRRRSEVRSRLNNFIIEGCVLAFSVISPQSAYAGPIHERLNLLIGSDKETIIALFGHPQLSTAGRLSFSLYSYPGRASMALLKHNTPIADGSSRSSSGMVTQQYPGVSSSPQPCLLDFHLSPTSTVDNVRYRGPGCFEIVFSRTIPGEKPDKEAP